MEDPQKEQKKVPQHKPTIYIMAAIILMFIVGIFTRWDYIEKEVTDTFRRLFPAEQSK